MSHAERQEKEDKEDVAAPAEAVGAYHGAPFTLFVTIVCVLVFIGEVWMTLLSPNVSWSDLAQVIVGIPDKVAMTFGANYATSTLYEGRVDTLLASCFLHAGILHLLFNMYALRQVGPFLEHEVGTGRAAVLYIGSGIVGSMVSAIYRGWATQGQGLGVGASGAICGLIGGAFVVGFRTQGWRSPLMIMMGIWLAITLLLGTQVGFDNAAHAGGAAAGALIAVVWRRGAEPRVLRTVSITAAVGSVVAAAVAVVYFDLSRPFATMSAAERRRFAEQAVQLGACEDAWAAIRTARRVAPRADDVLQTVQIVRAHCGQDPNTPRGAHEGALPPSP